MSNASAIRFLDRTTPPHLATLILVAGIAALSMNIFLPSLPDLAEHFDTDYSVIQLSVATYLAFNAVLQIMIGPISDRYGRRPVLLAGLVIFILATIGCIFAPTVQIFLTFRMIQASVVVGMVLSRAIVRDMYDAEQAASTMAYVSMGMAVAPMLGPVIGGYLGSAFGWQASFWLLAVGGVLAYFACYQDLAETAPKQNATFRDQFVQYPELLTSPRFWGYCLAMAFASGAFFAFLGGAPYVGTEVFGLSTKQVGIYLGAPTLGYFLGNWFSGRYATRIGLNGMVLWGTTLVTVGMAVSLFLFYIGIERVELFFGFVIFVGLGNGMVIPNATSGMLSVRPHLAGSASGLGGFMMIGGGAALSALAGVMLTPGSGAYPLMWLMFLTSLASLLAILYVIKRARQIGAA